MKHYILDAFSLIYYPNKLNCPFAWGNLLILSGCTTCGRLPLAAGQIQYAPLCFPFLMGR